MTETTKYVIRVGEQFLCHLRVHDTVLNPGPASFAYITDLATAERHARRPAHRQHC